MRIKKLLFICAATMLFGSNAGAASLEKKALEMKITPREIQHYKKVSVSYTKAYEDLAAEVNKGIVDQSRIRSMRAYYSKTKEYTPFSESLINRMTGFAYVADTSSDMAEVNNALAEYKKLLDNHIINFDVLNFALTMARADVRFGDELLLNKIRQYLIKDLTGLINIGKTPERAYTIVAYGEETFVLEELNANIIDSELFKIGRSFFNVYEIETPEGEYVQVYMNVTEPIRNIRLRQIIRDQEERANIPGQ